MNKLIVFLKRLCRMNKDLAKIEIGPLKMFLEKKYKYDYPHETSLYIPRVEVREKIETFLFTKTKETIYNSITIVNAPRAPLSNENNHGPIIPIDLLNLDKEQNNSE